MKKNVFWFALILAFFMFNTHANAALINNGNSLIYDTALNVTFYDYCYGATTGGTNLAGALEWASGLTEGGVSGWRLPTTDVLALANNVGEMGELYHVELGLNGASVVVPTSNQLPFVTLHPNFYWTSTSAPDSGTNAYYTFEFDIGRQWAHFDTVQLFALAVHDGNIGGTPPVPIPATLMLLGSGLVGLAGFKKKFKK